MIAYVSPSARVSWPKPPWISSPNSSFFIISRGPIIHSMPIFFLRTNATMMIQMTVLPTSNVSSFVFLLVTVFYGNYLLPTPCFQPLRALKLSTWFRIVVITTMVGSSFGILLHISFHTIFGIYTLIYSKLPIWAAIKFTFWFLWNIFIFQRRAAVTGRIPVKSFQEGIRNSLFYLLFVPKDSSFFLSCLVFSRDGTRYRYR